MTPCDLVTLGHGDRYRSPVPLFMSTWIMPAGYRPEPIGTAPEHVGVDIRCYRGVNSRVEVNII